MPNTPKVLFVFGTRPEAIKMAPVIKVFKSENDFETRVCVTGQHREMLDQVLSFFEINPDYDLELMRQDQTLYTLTSSIVEKLELVLEEFKPKYVFVHGDTTTTCISALTSFYAGCKVCHVEAGLRTYNKFSPFPEEMNRQLTGRLADFHFAPTIASRNNLLKEGTLDSTIKVTGNTVIDALFDGVEKVKSSTPSAIKKYLSRFDQEKHWILVTGHRRENFGDGFLEICHALKEIAQSRSNVEIIYPVHLNPNVQKPVFKILDNVANVHLISPLEYPSFIWLMNKSHFIITDSGGVQEEAPSLGKPVLVMRNTTERPEAVEAGTVKLVGTDKNLIISASLSLIDDFSAYQRMSKSHNPYGDGKAANRILDFIKHLEYEN
ncbi:MAG: UDP-N-acetylglucosamine 2-epimerase (non-hydrolyzing) [Bacteroidota bacterium]